MLEFLPKFKLSGGHMNNRIKILTSIMVILILFSCGLTDKLYINMNFAYKLTDKFEKLNDKMVVFVHFWRKKQDKMLLNFDHTFKSVGIKDISKWKKGDIIKYSKKIYIPKFLDDYDAEFDGFEKINLTIGLHEPNGSAKKIILFHKEIRVEAEESHAPAINYQEGWHDIETNPKAKEKFKKWQWTTQMGTDYMFTLNIESDMFFVPSKLDPNSKDDRELGMQIYYIYFRESIK